MLHRYDTEPPALILSIGHLICQGKQPIGITKVKDLRDIRPFAHDAIGDLHVGPRCFRTDHSDRTIEDAAQIG